MLTAKRREKIEKALANIRARHPTQRCWVCGTRKSMKTSRESYGLRCRKCLDAHLTHPDIVIYEDYAAEIDLGHKPRASV